MLKIGSGLEKFSESLLRRGHNLTCLDILGTGRTQSQDKTVGLDLDPGDLSCRNRSIAAAADDEKAAAQRANRRATLAVDIP